MHARIIALGRGIYHLIDRITAKEFFLIDGEKDVLHEIILDTSGFDKINVLTMCIMDNHLHLLVEVPEWKMVTDEELIESIKILYRRKERAKKLARVLEKLERLEEDGDFAGAEKLRQSYRDRMYNLADFMKTVKEDYAESFNRRYQRLGPFWAGRFKSILLNNKPGLLLLIAMYIDLNPVRASMKGIGNEPARFGWSGIGLSVRHDRDAVKGLRRLRDLTGFTREGCSDQDLVLHYHALLTSYADSRSGYSIPPDLKELLETEIKIEADDRRFDPKLRSRRSITIWQMIHCRCRFFCYGQVLGSASEELRNLKVGKGKTLADCRPVRTPIPFFASVRRLRGPSVLPSPALA